VAIYVRISVDRSGRGEGVEQQERWGRAYCGEHWPGMPVRVYCDNDLSAAKEDVYRPDYVRLREDIAAGLIAHVWCVEQSRLERSVIGWFTLAAELQRAGIERLHTNRDGIVPVGDLVAGIKALVNADEAKRTRERVRDDLADLAAQGRPGGGMAYGYKHVKEQGQPVRLEIVPEHADVIREAARRVLVGETLTGVARDFNEWGITTAKGKRWVAAGIKSILTSGTQAGRRTHRGEDVGPGTWEPIISYEDHLALRAKLLRSTGDNGAPIDRRAARKYLLSGLVYCSDCEVRMVGAPKGDGKSAYKCKGTTHHGCGRTISAEQLEAHVTSRLFAKLDHITEVRRQLTVDVDAAKRRDEIAAELGKIRDKRRLYGTMLASDDMDLDTYQSARAALAEKERALNTELAELPDDDADQLDPDAIRHAWEHNTVDERRDIIGEYVDQVLISPLDGDKPKRFDPNRVHITGAGWD
jgi:site-specific DNA recombinase